MTISNTRYRVLPYKQGSRSAKALADALGGKVLKLEGSKSKPRPSDIIINWGNTNTVSVHWPGAYPHDILNLPNQIRNASNKLNFFNLMKEAGNEDIIPRFWTKKEDIPNDDEKLGIVARATLAGHSGEGITIHRDLSQLPQVPLYVEYKKKKDEYRVHVGMREINDPFNEAEHGQVKPTIIAIQRKARRVSTPDEEVNWQVRNLAGGFVFVREGVNPPEAVISAAKRALEASGLDFGAVDVIWNDKEQKAYVLEINTAPGLEGQTVQDYATFFKA